MTTWLTCEMAENRSNHPLKKKAYWERPKRKTAHDPRGVPSYVGSKYYIPTPGDNYARQKSSWFSTLVSLLY